MKYNKLLVILFFSQINSIVWIHEELMFNCSFFYHLEGDINMGVVLKLGCNITHYKEKYHRIVPFLLAVDEINTNTKLLPNVTIGFTF